MIPMRTNLVLAAVAGGLAVPTVLTFLADRTAFTEIDKIPRLFEGFTAENIRYLDLQKQKLQDGKPVMDAQGQPARERLVLFKQDDKWRIGDGELAGVPADVAKVERDVLDHVKRIRINRDTLLFPGADDKTLDQRELSLEKCTLIRCLDREQKPVAELVVGADASKGKWDPDVVKGRYVRRLDNKDVVLYDADEAQYWNLTLKADDWIDKKVHDFNLQLGKVKSFALKTPKGEVAFEKEKPAAGAPAGTPEKWKATKAPDKVGAVRQQEVTNLVSRFATLYVQRFQEPVQARKDLKDIGLDPADVTVSATLEDGTVYTLEIGHKIADKQECHARSNHSDFLLAIGDYDRTAYIDRNPVDLFDPPAEAVASQPALPPDSQPQQGK
jgi:hypothetical protein